MCARRWQASGACTAASLTPRSRPASWGYEATTAADPTYCFDLQAMFDMHAMSNPSVQPAGAAQLAVAPFSSSQPAASSAPASPMHRVDLPEGWYSMPRAPAWSPTSSHVAALSVVEHASGPAGLQLVLLRMADGASKHYVTDSLPSLDSADQTDLLWAPCSPAGRPRLAAIRSAGSQARPRCSSGQCCAASMAGG